MSLELKGTTPATVRKYTVKADAINDGKTANVDLDIVLDEDRALALGGKLFQRACFSDFIGKSSAVTARSKKLDGELKITAEHTMDIEGYPLSATPKITRADLEEKARVVTVHLRLPVPSSATKLRQMLEAMVGDEIGIEFAGVTQQEIEGTTSEQQHGPDDDEELTDEEWDEPPPAAAA